MLFNIICLLELLCLLAALGLVAVVHVLVAVRVVDGAETLPIKKQVIIHHVILDLLGWLLPFPLAYSVNGR